jgi:hypothetical protein
MLPVTLQERYVNFRFEVLLHIAMANDTRYERFAEKLSDYGYLVAHFFRDESLWEMAKPELICRAFRTLLSVNLNTQIGMFAADSGVADAAKVNLIFSMRDGLDLLAQRFKNSIPSDIEATIYPILCELPIFSSTSIDVSALFGDLLLFIADGFIAHDCVSFQQLGRHGRDCLELEYSRPV